MCNFVFCYLFIVGFDCSQQLMSEFTSSAMLHFGGQNSLEQVSMQFSATTSNGLLLYTVGLWSHYKNILL